MLQLTTGDLEFYGNIISLYTNANYSNYKAQPFKLRLFPSGSHPRVKSVKNIIIPFEEILPNGFSNFFDRYTAITKAPALPATTLGTACYS